MSKEELLDLLHEKGFTDEEIGALLRETVDAFDSVEDERDEEYEDEKEEKEHAKKEHEKKDLKKYFGVEL